jgi:branched-subunit amino acid transport protein AzlD
MNSHQIAMIVVMAVTVIALRALPVLIFGRQKRIPALLNYLGQVLTAGAIAMLVVYSLYGELNYAQNGLERLWSVLIASALTVALQLFFRNPLLSILGGTGCFMLLIQRIFV